ncbi:MAG: nucleoside triphosphate pyrophosphatase [Bdellovibrionota bacterium]
MKMLVLGSTSPYRKTLMESLMIPFSCKKPLCDEDKFKDQEKDPVKLASLLARKKAESLVMADQIIIGGDQLVSFQGKILGKPQTFEKALQQLSEMQGETHELITAVCVALMESSQNKAIQLVEFVDITKITLKVLSPKQISTYLNEDQPWDCAGSYKIEKHGMSLIQEIETKDFSAIQGLPLLRLSQVLHNLGYEIPKSK